jgi:hypothetical protein
MSVELLKSMSGVDPRVQNPSAIARRSFRNSSRRMIAQWTHVVKQTKITLD